MNPKPRFTYLEIRHDVKGLLEISNQYSLAFEREDFRRIVVILKGREDQQAAARIPADQVIFLQCPRLGGLNLRAVIALVRICRQNQVTHVLTHRFKPAQIAGLAARFLDLRMLICVIHGNHQFDRASRQIATRLLLSGPRTRLVGVSETTRDDIQAHLPFLPANRIRAIPNCIDIETTARGLLEASRARQQLDLPGDAFVFGNIGRLSPAKDQLSMIRAFHLASPRMPGALLVIIGGGRLEAQLKQECTTLGILDRVRFTGAIDQAWQLIKAFDCFVSTSVTEGFGLVIVEAMVAKCPLIATRIGSFSEILADTVNLVPTGDTQAIADAMCTRFEASPAARKTLAQQLYARVCAEFSVPAFRQRVKQLRNELQ